MDRRKFIITIGSAGAAIAAIQLLKSGFRSKPTLLPQSNILLTSGGDGIFRIDLNEKSYEKIPLQMKPHSFIIHPLQKTIAVTVEKIGRNGAVVDFNTRQVIKNLDAGEGSYFYGHGLFQEDGKRLFLNRLTTGKYTGHLAVFDTSTYEEIEQLDLPFYGLHDMVYTNDPNVIAFTTAGMPILTDQGQPILNEESRIESSGVIFYDLKKKAVLDQSRASAERQALAHLIHLENGGTIVASNQTMLLNETQGRRKGSVFFISADYEMKQFNFPEEIANRIAGEILSLSADQKNGVVFATNPESSQVFAIDYINNKFLKSFDYHAYGVAVCYDLDIAILSSNTQLSTLKAIRLSDLTLIDFPIGNSTESINSPHLTLV